MVCVPDCAAIRVSHIHSVVPELILTSSPIDGETIHGVVELGGMFVPTIDTLAALGLGAIAPITGSPLVKIGANGSERMLPRIDRELVAPTMVGDREQHGDPAGD